MAERPSTPPLAVKGTKVIQPPPAPKGTAGPVSAPPESRSAGASTSRVSQVAATTHPPFKAGSAPGVFSQPTSFTESGHPFTGAVRTVAEVRDSFGSGGQLSAKSGAMAAAGPATTTKSVAGAATGPAPTPVPTTFERVLTQYNQKLRAHEGEITPPWPEYSAHLAGPKAPEPYFNKNCSEDKRERGVSKAVMSERRAISASVELPDIWERKADGTYQANMRVVMPGLAAPDGTGFYYTQGFNYATDLMITHEEVNPAAKRLELHVRGLYRTDTVIDGLRMLLANKAPGFGANFVAAFSTLVPYKYDGKPETVAAARAFFAENGLGDPDPFKPDGKGGVVPNLTKAHIQCLHRTFHACKKVFDVTASLGQRATMNDHMRLALFGGMLEAGELPTNMTGAIWKPNSPLHRSLTEHGEENNGLAEVLANQQALETMAALKGQAGAIENLGTHPVKDNRATLRAMPASTVFSLDLGAIRDAALREKFQSSKSGESVEGIGMQDVPFSPTTKMFASHADFVCFRIAQRVDAYQDELKGSVTRDRATLLRNTVTYYTEILTANGYHI